MFLSSCLLLALGCGGDPAPIDAGSDAFAAVDAVTTGDAPLATDAFVATDSPASVDARSAVDAYSAVDAPGGAFTLTSPAYAEGGVIPLTHVCTAQGGMNASPPLAWSGAPAGTLSFAIFFTDATTAFRHSAIYDIPSTLSALPADVDRSAMPADVPGARQPRGYPGTPGYAGPCPGSMHRYRFTLYALDVANLPGLTASSSLAAVESAMMAHSLGTATLTGTHTPP
jgi:Raf kinase inhibitor-like YbhB/YbcL family protein